jgi:hypothetical protein
MNSETMVTPDKTQFATSERNAYQEVLKEYQFFLQISSVSEYLDSIPVYILILNKYRQLIFANKTFLEFLGMKQNEEIIAKRPGEILDCQYADLMEGGCGTSEFCKTCGAVQAIINCLEGIQDVKECSITKTGFENTFEFKVWANPMVFNGERYTIFSLIDISSEKRKYYLERIFFHDILNTVSGIKGFTDLMSKANEEEKTQYLKMLGKLTNSLVEEILAQRILMGAENNDLAVKIDLVNVPDLVNELIEMYENHKVALQKFIQVSGEIPEMTIKTDAVIIKRVIGNMIKNALESSKEEESIYCGVRTNGAYIEFWVQNSMIMPEDVKLQIFKRSFSTKGSGRGMGTYSMRLLTEKYLKGKISFVSTEEKGTIFTISLPVNSQ